MKLRNRLLSLLLSVIIIFSIVPIGMFNVSAASAHSDSRVEYAVNWAINIANDDSHGYSQSTRKGNPNYDCSSLVSAAFFNAGFNVGNWLNTSNMVDSFTKAGFTYISANKLGGLSTSRYLQRGDILFYRYGNSGHTELYIGDNLLVGATSNRDGKNGDSDGKEIRVGNYYSATYSGYKWQGILRYTGGSFIGLTQDEYTIIEKNTNSSGNTHYNASASKQIGTYVCTSTVGVNIRTGVGTQHDKIGLVSRNGEIYVYETNGNWGKCTFAGKTGWVCLDYFNYKSVPVPSVPSINTTSGNVAIGGSVTVSWNQVNNVSYYELKTVSPSGKVTEEKLGLLTSVTKSLGEAGRYSFYVRAVNIENKTNGYGGAVTCTTHAPSTVKFIDWDGTEIKTVSVRYGDSAKAPDAPSRKGYSFQGWDNSYINITSNRTIKALYKVNTYTVNFYDRKGALLDSQKVNYNENATPPVDTNTENGYDFLGWDSEDYKNVYTEASNKTININGIYAWFNDDLPIICNITSAKRQQDGYYVYFDLKNYDKEITRGRAVVSLKTASGKLVDTTESAAFSIPKDATKTGMEVFVPCDFAATVVEVMIVESYPSGVPISERVSSTIAGATDWTNWSTDSPENSSDVLQVESKTEYRYRDKKFTTGNSNTKSGWNYINRTLTEGTWSGWQNSSISKFDDGITKRDVESRVTTEFYEQFGYVYYHFYKPGGGNHTYCPTNHAGGTYHGTYYSWKPFTWYKYSDCGGRDMYTGDPCTQGDGSTKYWFYNQSDSGMKTLQRDITQWRYRDNKYVYHFWQWGDWSGWSDTIFSKTDNRDVEQRTLYRYKSKDISIEDEVGIWRSVKGKVSSIYTGKQITLYVYGYTGASDYTNFYIGQSVIAEDGSYSFEYKLREEPSIVSGDLTVAVGIEGTNSLKVIDIIEAPKPKHTVTFYDFYGNIISTQIVTEGENAVVPEVDEINGYDFIGWDRSNINIKEDTEIFAEYDKKEFTVIFVDWSNQLIEVKTFKYGDVIITPDFTEVEGHDFIGWDEIENGNVLATKDMVITAQYEKETYTVKFYDFDGKVIDEQDIAYGDSAIVPNSPSKDGMVFAGWFNPDEYQNVNSDKHIMPSYYFEETAETPTVNYASGEYTKALDLTFTTSDENAVIYYYLNGNADDERIYTEPIEVSKSCSITYYAESLGKNASGIATNYYCINSDGSYSSWMPYSELPETVKDHPDDFVMESEQGYRFKNTKSTSSVVERESLIKEGWILSNVSETLYTDWQDEELTVDDTVIKYAVETQVVEDPTKTNYKYSHYKYTDSEGTVCYSPVEVDGFECKYEEIVVEDRLSIAGFLEDNTSYYDYDSQQWFKQTKVNGKKTQYRASYSSVELYKWTPWDVIAPESGDTRFYEASLLYRYTNKNYHIVTAITDLGEWPFTYLVQSGTAFDVTELDMYGYDFAGLYMDAEFTDSWDESNPVDESMTLYVKYEPKTYTVTFQMQDGTEIDSQEVVFMDSAVAPATDAVPGFVFAGWDKEFDMITEDTIITGKYFKESEYARVDLNNDKARMYVGNSISLVATITPSNLINETIEWSSSDSSIAVVDDKGNVTAVGAGEAVITVTVLKTKEFATCTVTVDDNVDSNIIINADASLNYDSLGYLRRIDNETAVEEARTYFDNEDLVFTDINGKILKESDCVGTGTVISLESGDKVLDKKTCIVTGDMNGDGMINNRDVSLLCRYLVEKEIPGECQILAMDANGDGSVNNKDAALLARYLVGKATI